MSQRFEGHNLEEALQSAAEALGVERWQLTHHVLLEKRGFLGGVKRIVIEADVNASAAPPPAPLEPLPDMPAAHAHSARGASGRPSHDGGRRGGGRREGGRGRDGHGGGEGRHGGRGRGNRGGRDLRVGDFETFLGDLPEQGPESEAARSVREWCETALRLANVDVVLRSEENETQINIRLYGSDAHRLTEHHGELLDAIQVLANKALVGRKVEKSIELDCEDFKEQRNDDLAQQARKVADRVRDTRREELLPAMTPIERRIVHVALQDDPEVTTESRGEGFYKRVAIILRSESHKASEEVAPATEQ